MRWEASWFSDFTEEGTKTGHLVEQRKQSGSKEHGTTKS